MGVSKILITGVAIAACLAGRAAAGDVKDVKAVARATAPVAAKAVVTVKLVIKVKSAGARGGGEREEKLEVLGTVVDPSGLTLVSASAVEPTAMLSQLARRGGRGGDTPRASSEVKEAALILEDGTEVEADVVLKDSDLDVAFIRPREPQKLDAVELRPRGRAPELLEDIFVVTRLGRGEGRAPAVALGTIRAVVKGPRTFYVTSAEVAAGTQGCLAYGADGAPIGVFLLRVNPAAGEGGLGGGRFGGGGRSELVSTVLRPIEDLLEVAKQAKEAKAPEKKPATEEPAPAPAPAPAPPGAPPAPAPAPGAPGVPGAPEPPR